MRFAGIAGLLGTAGTFASTVSTLSCCGPAVLGPASAMLTAGVAWLPNSTQYPLLYASLALTLVAFIASAGRHRRVLPLIVGVPGAIAVVLALHDAWDVETFRTLIWVGSTALTTAGISDVWSRMRACRRRPGTVRTRCAT
ncbi:MAG: MerC family mercury resistance protein [Gemmatimonadaceae bacterium]